MKHKPHDGLEAIFPYGVQIDVRPPNPAAFLGAWGGRTSILKLLAHLGELKSDGVRHE